MLAISVAIFAGGEVSPLVHGVHEPALHDRAIFRVLALWPVLLHHSGVVPLVPAYHIDDHAGLLAASRGSTSADGVIPAPASLRRIVGQGLDWALWGLIVFGVLAMVVGKYGLRLLG